MIQNIHVTAWGPLTISWATKKNVANDAAIAKIAESIKITPVQLALSWAVMRGTSVIPKSSSEERLRSNLESKCSQLLILLPVCNLSDLFVLHSC